MQLKTVKDWQKNAAVHAGAVRNRDIAMEKLVADLRKKVPELDEKVAH